MALPVLENGPYIFNVNNVFYCGTRDVKAKTAIFQMKELLVSLGGVGTVWSVVASCDRYSVKNIGDADPDLWDTYENVVWGSSSRSWVVLENSTTGAQLCLDTNSAGIYMDIEYSPAGTFAADGTTTSRPTDTDAMGIIAGGVLWTSSETSYVNFAIHAMMSADHKTTRVFISERGGFGYQGGFALLIEEMVNTPAHWTSVNKTAVWLPTNTAYSTTPNAMSPRFGQLSNHSFWAFVETADPYSGWDNFYLTCECYGITSDTSGIGTFKVNTELPLLGGYPINPMGGYRPDADRGGSMGKFRDIYLAPDAHDHLTTYPNDATRQWIKIGGLFVPWNGTEPMGV
jgi:hypothetical protein